jgi:Domain of unknown function (DUF4160)
MGKIAIYKFLQFFIFSYDALFERPHLHIAKSNNYKDYAKIWLDTVKFANTGDLSSKDQKKVIELVENNKEVLMMQFEMVKQEKKIKTINLLTNGRNSRNNTKD